jgi:hypothetical protein
LRCLSFEIFKKKKITFSFSFVFTIKIIFRIFATVEEICLPPYELLDNRVHANKNNAVFAALQKVRNARHAANPAGLIKFFC